MTDTITIELGFGVTTREQRLEVDSACRTALTNPEKLQFLNPAGLHYHQGSGRLSFNGVGFKGACIDVGDMNGRTEDLVTDLIERTEVAVASAWSAGYDSGRKRLTNPTRSDEELRSAAVDVLRRLAANSDARSDLTKRENDAIIAGRGTEDFADEWLALRDEAKELAQESRDLLSALSKTVEDPPPTATETSEPASESVDSSRGGDELIFEAEAGVKIVQRFDGEPNEYELVMPSGNRNIWFTDREAAIYCAQVVGSCWLEAEAYGAMEEREAAANPSPPEEGVRLTGALKSLAKPGCDYCKGTGRLIMHERNGAGGGSNVDRVCTCLANRPVRPLSEGGEEG